MRDIEKEATVAARCRRTGELLSKVGRGGLCKGLVDGRVTRIRVRLPTEEDPSVLLIVQASDSQGDWIAFVGAPSVVDALLAWRAKETSRGLRWRKDVPWEER